MTIAKTEFNAKAQEVISEILLGGNLVGSQESANFLAEMIIERLNENKLYIASSDFLVSVVNGAFEDGVKSVQQQPKVQVPNLTAPETTKAPKKAPETPAPQAPARIIKKEHVINLSKWIAEQKEVPLREMVGEITRETAKAVYVKAQGLATPTSTCRRCGKELTHPVSLLFGIGPTCAEKAGIIRNASQDMVEANLEAMKAKLEAITFEGWLPKSQIKVRPYVEVAQAM